MKFLKYILVGTFFGIVMVKSEAASWFRIQEMFRFQSFHMYGIIGTAVVLGMAGIFLIKRLQIKSLDNKKIDIPAKELGWKRYLIGGTIFGLGWALTGACPGPIFVNIGYGYLGMILVAIGALGGTYLYGVIKRMLPH